MSMGFPPHTPSSSGGNSCNTPTGSAAEDGNSKKVRKPYTITKSRESWTEQEHDKFLEALQLFDRDWKKIEAFVGSKTVIQIRSHAQKYFLKVQKSGTNEHVPPPRPKRKAAHPYPQKAPKTTAMPQLSEPMKSSVLLSPGYVNRPDSRSALRKPAENSPVSSWSVNPPQPDFHQVYNFIGNVFDPDLSNHLEQLKQMDPINSETALLLMRNLSMNLRSPEFDSHKLLLQSYEANSDGRGRHFGNILATSAGSPIPAT